MSSIGEMESVVATVSGYHGCERFKLIKLISHTGANYVGSMTRSTTHLVCWRFEGKKFEFARSIGTKIVSHRWFEDCMKAGKRIQEGPYCMESGEEAGPILWEIPDSSIDKIIKKQGKTKEKCVLSDSCDFTDITNSEIGCSNFSRSFLLEENDPFTSKHEKKDSRTSKKRRRNSRQEINTRDRDNISEDTISDWPDESDFDSFWRKPRHQTSMNDFIEIKPSKNKGKNYLTNTSNSYQANSSKSSKDCALDISNENENGDEIDADVVPSQHKQLGLSCVICWTEFSSTRGVLPCGHRFCYSCIQDWSNRLVSGGKVSTCPLCKAAFYKITRVEEADFSDQKIYSQTIPIGSRIIPIGPSTSQIFTSFENLPILFEEGVCCKCHSRGPEDLLVNCEMCKSKWVHSYCLDPPQFPWTCLHCRDLRVLYQRYR